MRGCYRDILTDPEGRVQWDSGWRSNLVVQNCNLLLAALMKRHPGMQGILYWAIGEGEEDWDSRRSIPLLATSRLISEVARRALTPDQITYLDSADQPIETPSLRLEVTAQFRGQDFVSSGSQPWQEFGLFGGDASEERNSGFMIDYVIHPRIDLTPGVTLNRKLRLTFAAGALRQDELGGFGAGLSVVSIDRVGDEYGSDLRDEGIDSLGDLVQFDPLRPVGNIPQVKLREFRAKARMVMRLQVSLAPFTPLADHSIGSFLRERPEQLAEAVDAPGVTPGTVMRLQEELAVLQVALDDAQLQRVTLGDLINV